MCSLIYTITKEFLINWEGLKHFLYWSGSSILSWSEVTLFLWKKSVFLVREVSLTHTAFPSLAIWGFLLPMKRVGGHFSILVPKSGITSSNSGKNSNRHPEGWRLSFSSSLLTRCSRKSRFFFFSSGFARVLITVRGAVISAHVQKRFWIMFSAHRKEQERVPPPQFEWLLWQTLKAKITCALQNPGARSPGAKYTFRVSPGQRQGGPPHWTGA